MEKEALLSSEGGIEEEGGNVASNKNDDNVQILSIKHLETDDLGTFTETEDELGGARVEIAMSKSVRISDDPPDLIGGGGERRTREEDDIVYTVEDAIDQMGFGPFQILVTIFAGMVWISDAMEVMLLSVLSPIVTCDWNLEDWEEAMITSVVFVGFLIGGLFWGIIADIIGRKRVLLIVTFLIILFGLGSAAAPNYGSLLLFRCLAGFGIGGTAQAVTYYTEFLPKKLRGACLVLIEVWWAIGSGLAALLALAVIPNVPDPIETSNPDYQNINWRIYVGLCALPMIIVLVFFLFVPESARFYVSKNQYDKGQKVIAAVARINLKPPPPGRLVSQEDKELIEEEREQAAAAAQDNNNTEISGAESSFMDNIDEDQAPLLKSSSPPTRYTDEEEEGEVRVLSRWTRVKMGVKDAAKKSGQDFVLLFSGGMWKTSSLLLILWLGCAWLYYGAILLTTVILETGFDPHCGNTNQSLDSGCQNLTSQFYYKIIYTSAAEFPGIIITLIIIELVGRKFTMAAEFFGSAVFFGLILICVSDTWLTIFLFGARAFVTGVFQAVYVYTPEVFPTKVRGVAMGFNTAAARIGAIVTPFVAQALFPKSDYATIGLYVGSALIFAVLSLLLPIETKGRSLRDNKGTK